MSWLSLAIVACTAHTKNQSRRNFEKKPVFTCLYSSKYTDVGGGSVALKEPASVLVEWKVVGVLKNISFRWLKFCLFVKERPTRTMQKHFQKNTF